MTDSGGLLSGDGLVKAFLDEDGNPGIAWPGYGASMINVKGIEGLVSIIIRHMNDTIPVGGPIDVKQALDALGSLIVAMFKDVTLAAQTDEDTKRKVQKIQTLISIVKPDEN